MKVASKHVAFQTLLILTVLVASNFDARAQDARAQDARAKTSVQYNRDIKPLLAENCFACHGIDAEAREADLRLDDRESAIESGAVTPNDVDNSSLIERIFSEDDDTIMPPRDSHKVLTDQQKELIKDWVASGADYQKHWSLIAPEKTEPPQDLEKPNWARNDIDRFVQFKLQQQGLSPANEADPRTLFRRLSLDINGLPPSPEDVDEFQTDFDEQGDEAVSKWIDKLMERSSWGEHRARYWLDAARYADTHGMHFDNYREIWPYRDWVIRSFNNNQPFDQFTVEQLAGDLLEQPTQDQLIATGFQRCNMTTNEGGTIKEENLALYAADRVQTFGWVYLGLTTNCCQCHDHKFDPISMKDYYSLAAFFRNTTQGALDGNVKDGKGPVIVVPSSDDKERWLALPDEVAAAKEKLSDRKTAAQTEFETWLAEVDSESIGSLPTKGLLLHLPMNEGSGNEVKRATTADDDSESDSSFTATADLKWEPDGIVGPAPRLTKDSTITLGEFGNFSTEQSRSIGCWVKTTSKRSGAIVGRMDNEADYRGWDIWQNDGEFATHVIDKWTENGLKVITKGKQVKPGTWQHLMVTWDGSGKAAGLKIYVDGKSVDLNVATETLKEGADSKTETPLRIGRRSTGQYPFEGFVQDFVLYERTLDPTEIENIAQQAPLRLAISTPKEDRTKSLTESLLNHYLINQDKPYVALNEHLQKLVAEQELIKTRSPVTHVQVEKEDPAMANILMRGAYDNVGDEVTAAPPSALHPMPKDAPANRFGLAQWVVDPANPLTARVTVNRFWQELFGQGLVATSEDFGVMGAPPANQELLDWLAVDFRESNWDVKRLFKMMLMSSTYRQAATVTDLKLEKDRDNALLSRGPRFRMDAEMIRDYALSASGLLNEKLYGPGARPYQPENLWEIVGLPGGDTREYKQDEGPDIYRRSIYSFWKRMSPPPNLESFNAPSREVCTVRRERTNTPLQALVTLNDQQFVEAARVLAEKAMEAGDGNRERTLEHIAAKTICRTLQQTELNILDESFEEFLNHYQDQQDEAKKLISFGQSPVDEKLNAAELAAWTMVCNQMLNLDEVLNK
jgi:cytochrome c553